ncbi:acyl carrier protein phosphodiesterase [Salinisphaera aquimarina]|uniref:ACP phosphodiesterase n=1 Tax=Salinisphaera aquimarina TaxID=2094031 RepID=A0ABV7ERG2_9GAMM
MNLLAHFYLAQCSGTSYAGQVLGDVVKGRLDDRYSAAISQGIRLHRHIDRFSDDHANHLALRNRFEPPLRRYAGILVDIGFDFSLARAWPAYSDQSLATFASQTEQRVRAEWPDAAPFDNSRMQGLAGILAGYDKPEGLQRALDSVARRLRRANPVSDALPELLMQRDAFDDALPALLSDLEHLVMTHTD